jgi:hypothetical protein
VQSKSSEAERRRCSSSQVIMVGEVNRKLGVTEQTYYLWRRVRRDADRAGVKAQGVGKGERETREAGG